MGTTTFFIRETTTQPIKNTGINISRHDSIDKIVSNLNTNKIPFDLLELTELSSGTHNLSATQSIVKQIKISANGDTHADYTVTQNGLYTHARVCFYSP